MDSLAKTNIAHIPDTIQRHCPDLKAVKTSPRAVLLFWSALNSNAFIIVMKQAIVICYYRPILYFVK